MDHRTLPSRTDERPRARLRAAVPLVLGGSVRHHYGSSDSAIGPGVRYDARVASTSFDLRAGYSFWLADRFIVRPGLAGGLTVVSGHTHVANLTASNADVVMTLGPSLTALVRAGTYLFGVEGDARFVPSLVAGPIAALYGTFRVRL